MRFPVHLLAVVCTALLFLLVSAAPSAPLATSRAGGVSAEELRVYLRARMDSDYATGEAADYLTTAGLRRAVTDILLERELARGDRARRLRKQPRVAARLEAERRRILADMAQDLVNSETTVTDARLSAAYRDNATSFTREEMVEMLLCQVRLSPEDGGAAAMAAAERARASLAAAGDGRANPPLDGVTSGKVTAKRGDLPPEVEKVIFAARPGEVTPVIRRTRAAYVARVLARQEPGLAPLEEVRDDLRGELWRAERARLEEENLRPLVGRMPLVVDHDTLGAATTTETTVLARVGETAVTLADLEVVVSGGVPPPPWDAAAKRDALAILERLATRIRVVAWAGQRGLDARDDFRIDHEQARNKMLAQLVLLEAGQAAAAATTPTREQLGAMLAAEPENPEFLRPTEYTVEEMLVSPTVDMDGLAPAQRDELDRRMQGAAERVRVELAGGSDPRAVVERFRETSMTLAWKDLGTAPQGPRGRVVDLAVKDLEPGGVSAPERTRSGYAVYRLTERIPERRMTVEQDTDQLEQTWRSRRAAEARQRLIDAAAEEVSPVFDEDAMTAFTR